MTPAKKLTIVRPTSAVALNDGHDAAAAKQLNKLFLDAQLGMRRIVALGLFAWEIKESKLKKNQFGEWLAAHCPKLARVDSKTGKSKPSAALSSYMSLTRGVLENVGFTVEKYLKHISSDSHAVGICRGGKYLLLPDSKLPAGVKELKGKICELVDGKTKHQLFTEFKQAEENEAGELKPKRGRLKGQGGATKLQREAAQLSEEQARIEQVEIRAVETSEWLLEAADDKHIGLISDAALVQLIRSTETALHYMRTLADAKRLTIQ